MPVLAVVNYHGEDGTINTGGKETTSGVSLLRDLFIESRAC